MTKTCIVCQVEKDLNTGFYRANSGYRAVCKVCHNTRTLANRVKNPQAKGKARDTILRKQYDLTAKEYEYILAQQHGMCAACGLSEKNGRRLAVDHDHKTGMVRALLCIACNTSLGLLREEPKRIQALLDYSLSFRMGSSEV